MSIKLMQMVLDRYPTNGNERLLAVSLANFAGDDGKRVWPSVGLLAEKVGTSARTIQRLLRNMEARGWLIRVRTASGRVGDSNEYVISPQWISGGDPLPAPSGRGDKLSPLENGPENTSEPVDNVIHTGDTTGVRGDTSGLRGDTVMSPESSGTVKNRYSPLPPDGGASEFEAIWAIYPNHDSKAAALRAWKRLRPDTACQGQMAVAIHAKASTSRWKDHEGRFVPLLVNWLKGECWLDEGARQASVDWWREVDGIKGMGLRLGLGPFSLASLGNGYTDDQRFALWKTYRDQVFAAAGNGVWMDVYRARGPKGLGNADAR